MSKRVTVVRQERYDDGPIDFGASWEPGSLDRVIRALLTVRASIPAEFRRSATCEIDSEGGYEGSHYATVEIAYERPATNDDIAEAEAVRRAMLEELERRERVMLSHLRQKYVSM